MGVLSGHRSVVFRFTQGSVLWQQKDRNKSVMKIVLLKSEFCYYLGSGKFEVEFSGKNKQWYFFILVTKCQLFCLHWRVTHCQSLTSRDAGTKWVYLGHSGEESARSGHGFLCKSDNQ